MSDSTNITQAEKLVSTEEAAEVESIEGHQAEPVVEEESLSDEIEYVSQGLIRDVWYGQRSLGFTFWVCGFLIQGIGLGIVGAAVVTLIANSIGLPILAYIFGALLMPVGLWTLVGCWRSATNHPGFWAGAFKVYIVLSFIIIFIGAMAGV